MTMSPSRWRRRGRARCAGHGEVASTVDPGAISERERLPGQAFKRSVDALLRDGYRGPDRLGEQAHPQLLDHPPDGQDIRPVPGSRAKFGEPALVIVTHSVNDRHAAGVAPDVGRR